MLYYSECPILVVTVQSNLTSVQRIRAGLHFRPGARVLLGRHARAQTERPAEADRTVSPARTQIDWSMQRMSASSQPKGDKYRVGTHSLPIRALFPPPSPSPPHHPLCVTTPTGRGLQDTGSILASAMFPIADGQGRFKRRQSTASKRSEAP